MSRLSRKKIKRDEVMETVGSAFQFTRAHMRGLVIGIVAVALLAIGYSAYRSNARARQGDASDALAAALRTLEAPVDAADSHPDDAAAPSFATAAARDERARAALEAIRAEFPRSDAAAIAAVHLGRLAAESDDLEGARALWESALRGRGDDLLAAEVRLDLIELERAAGRSAELVESLRSRLARGDDELPEALLLHQLAHTLEQLDRKAEARDVYQRLAEEHPTSVWGSRAEQQARQLVAELEG